MIAKALRGADTQCSAAALAPRSETTAAAAAAAAAAAIIRTRIAAAVDGATHCAVTLHSNSPLGSAARTGAIDRMRARVRVNDSARLRVDRGANYCAFLYTAGSG